jgi:hypothetical protein
VGTTSPDTDTGVHVDPDAVTAPLPLPLPPDRGSRRSSTTVPAVVAAAVVVVLFAGALAWHLSGGRWQIISTPSMGTAAPVGSVVLTRPDHAIAVGDVITFTPPAPERPRSVTHRVVAVEPGTYGPGLRTQGDINGSVDPWLLHAPDLTGRVVAVVPGLGWFVRALPALIAGIVLLWWATRRFMPWLWAVPTRVLGLSLLLAAVSLWLRPFVGTTTLATQADAGEARISLVSTGVLPTRVTADTGGVLDLISGQTGLLTTPRSQESQGNLLTSGVHMPWWLWIVMTAFWLLPMVYGLVAARRHPLVGPDDDRPDEPDDRRRPLDPDTDPGPRDPGTRRGAAPTFLGMTLALALTVSGDPSFAAFTATVRNTTSTAGAAAYFSCLDATAGFGSNYIAWPLDDANVSNLATARSLTGGTTGTYNGLLGFTAAASKPCPRDTPARAVTINGSAVLTPYVATTNATAIASTNVFSIVGWFRTNTLTGGRMIGWSSSRTGLTAGGYDRHLYMTNSGQLVFGVYPNATKTVTSPAAYNDDQWHLAVATLSPAGMVLYVDGAQVAADATTTTGEGGTTRTGYWRVGWDNLSGWPNAPTTPAWAGSMYDAAVMTNALTPAQVAQLYRAGT